MTFQLDFKPKLLEWQKLQNLKIKVRTYTFYPTPTLSVGRTSLKSIILVLYGRLKDQSKNNLAVIKKSESQAAHTSKENKLLADKNEKYAHYLNCVITAMNNSMSIKVSFILHHRHLVMLVTKFCLRLGRSYNVGDFFRMLGHVRCRWAEGNFGIITSNRSLTSKTCHQHKLTHTSITKSDDTETITDRFSIKLLF